MYNDEKLNKIETELFVREKKLNVLFVFIKQSYFKVPKYIRLNTTHYFITQFSYKKEL